MTAVSIHTLPMPSWYHDDAEAMPDLDELEFPAHIDEALTRNPVWRAGYYAGWSVGHASALAAVTELQGGAR